jgi:hypothetical protein
MAYIGLLVSSQSAAETAKMVSIRVTQRLPHPQEEKWTSRFPVGLYDYDYVYSVYREIDSVHVVPTPPGTGSPGPTHFHPQGGIHVKPFHSITVLNVKDGKFG